MYFLSAKNTVATEILRKNEHITPDIDENNRVLAFLGIDKGNKISIEIKIPTLI
jgi:hypothetical protein